MKFAFTDEQLAFRDALRDLLTRECSPAVVREAWTNDTGRTKGLWAQLAEMGVLGALAPEVRGGLGLGEIDAVLLIEETGYAAVPEPIVEHMLVGVPLLAAAGDPRSDAADLTITAQCVHEPIVNYADTADLLVLHHDDRLHVIKRDDTQLAPHPSVDGSRRTALVTWTPTTETVVGSATDAQHAFDRGSLGTAAQLIGLTRRMLDLTVAYVSERQQFGVPIGSFQAVKHHLADARIALEFARPLTYRAAWSMAEDDPAAPVHVSMAKAAANDAAALTARKALQCHGAMGYSFEYDLHLFMKRAWALAQIWGDSAWHRARVARAIL
jgi:alkylation response protein AidB-like acyl-CoA dehydrogenase